MHEEEIATPHSISPERIAVEELELSSGGELFAAAIYFGGIGLYRTRRKGVFIKSVDIDDPSIHIWSTEIWEKGGPLSNFIFERRRERARKTAGSPSGYHKRCLPRI
jgi:hypothetical protein